MLAHELTVIVNGDGIAVRPLLDGPARRVEVAFPRDAPPATRAVVELLRELGAARQAHFSAAGHAIR